MHGRATKSLSCQLDFFLGELVSFSCDLEILISRSFLIELFFESASFWMSSFSDLVPTIDLHLIGSKIPNFVGQIDHHCVSGSVLSTTIRAGVTSWSPAHSCPHHHCTTLLLFDYCTVVMQPLYHITPYCTRSHHNNQRSPSHNLGYKGYNQGFVKGDKLFLYPDFIG